MGIIISFLDSQIVRDQINCDLNIPYGQGLREKFDLYGTDLDEGKMIEFCK
mgnify:CR=1 FL=1